MARPRVDRPGRSGDPREVDRPPFPAGPVGVLAIQGSFALHERSLAALGVPSRLVRKPADLEGLSALVIPGGESTVMSLLLEKYDLFEAVQRLGCASSGLPMLGTCAGAILLGRGEGRPRRLELAPVQLERNAYGTQIDSFTAELELKPFARPFHGVFIRAPRIVRCGAGTLGAGVAQGASGASGALGPSGPADAAVAPVEVLGRHEDDPVLVACGNLLLATFHPELTDDLRVHRFFIERFVLGSGHPTCAAPEATAACSSASPTRNPA